MPRLAWQIPQSEARRVLHEPAETRAFARECAAVLREIEGEPAFVHREARCGGRWAALRRLPLPDIEVRWAAVLLSQFDLAVARAITRPFQRDAVRFCGGE